ncbi:hypothetical protein Q5752_001976 [Cryptotrichosporon argae]
MTAHASSDSPTPPGTLRVAVVGSGLAGLTAAYLLRRRGVEVWLVEKSDTLGFHSASVEVPAPADSARRGCTSKSPATPCVVDVPMRSFQGGYYPLLLALYAHLGLSIHPTRFAFSFSRPTRDSAGIAHTRPSPSDAYFIHEGASGLALPSLPSAAYRSPRAFWRALSTLVQFAACYILLVLVAFADHHDVNPYSRGTLAELVEAVDAQLTRLPLVRFAGVFPAFVDDVVVPLFSAAGTMTAHDVLSTPACAVLGYIHLTVGTSHYALHDASARDVAALLSAPVDAQGSGYVRVGAAITGLRRRADRSIALCVGDDEVVVDRVVVATQARAASQLLGSFEPSLVIAGDKSEGRRVARMRKALGEVEYRDTIVVTHRDASILPNRRDRREINLVQPPFERRRPRTASPGRSPTHSRAVSSTSAIDASRPTRATAPLDATSQSTRSTSSSRHPSSRFSRSPSPGVSSAPSTRPNTPLTPVPFFDPADAYTMATHIAHPGIYQTTNPIVPIDAASVLAVARLERALPVSRAETLANLRPAGTDDELIHLAGSYAYPGVPLLEGCVGSARIVVDAVMRSQPAQREGIDWDAGRGGLARRAWTWKWTVAPAH